MKLYLALGLVCASLQIYLAGKCEKYPGTSKKVYKYKTYGEQWEAFFVYVNGTVAPMDPRDILKGSKKVAKMPSRTSYEMDVVHSNSCAIIVLKFKIKYVDSIAFSLFDADGTLITPQKSYAFILDKTDFSNHTVKFNVGGVAKIGFTFRIYKNHTMLCVKNLFMVSCCP